MSSRCCRAEMYDCAKFNQNWSIHCQNIYFSRWQPSADLDLFGAYLATHEEYLVVFIIVQNLADINEVLLLQLNHFMALWILSGTIWVSQYQKGKTKTNLDFLEQKTVSGSGISWAICTLPQTDNHASTPVPPLSFFTGRMPFLPPNVQRQSTEGN